MISYSFFIVEGKCGTCFVPQGHAAQYRQRKNQTESGLFRSFHYSVYDVRGAALLKRGDNSQYLYLIVAGLEIII